MIRLVQVVTPVHVGEGQAVGAVDLPIARERHTGWPWIPASGLKGALRDRSRRLDHPVEAALRVFGSEPGAKPLTRGAVRFGDAILVAVAVRSLGGGAALLTSPLALARLALRLDAPPPIPEPTVERALTARRDALLVPEMDRIVLEDLPLLVDGDPRVGAWAEALRGWVGDDAPLENLVVAHDEVFAFACEAWLPLRTRAAIADDGVVKDGQLFTTEALPAESLLAVDVDGDDEGLLPGDGEVFVVGGHKTVGAGRLAWYRRNG